MENLRARPRGNHARAERSGDTSWVYLQKKGSQGAAILVDAGRALWQSCCPGWDKRMHELYI